MVWLWSYPVYRNSISSQKRMLNGEPPGLSVAYPGRRATHLLVLHQPLQRLRLEVAAAPGPCRDHTEGGPGRAMPLGGTKEVHGPGGY